MIQENLSAPCTVLDFPTREAFARELTAHHYDIVGISSIIVNVGKAREMCRMVREISPHSTIIVGGHVAAIPGIEQILDADHIVKGDGIEWMRRYLGEDVNAPIRHPALSLRLRPAHHGRQSPRQVDRPPPSSPRWAAHGLQLLHHFGLLRRQGESGEPLLHRRGAVPTDGAGGSVARREVVLYHGREFSAAKAAGHGPAGAHEGRRQELGSAHFLVGQRHPQVQLRGTGGTGRLFDLAGT